MTLLANRGVAAQPVKLWREIKNFSGILAFSPDGKTLATAYGSAVDLLDLKTGHLQKHKIKIPDYTRALALSPDGKTLMTGDGGQFTGSVKLWDIQTGKLKRVLAQGHLTESVISGIGPVLSVAFSPDGKIVAVGVGCESEPLSSLLNTSTKGLCHGKSNPFLGDGVHFLDAWTGKLVGQINDPVSRSGPWHAKKVAFSPTGHLIALGGDDGKVRIHSVRTCKLVSIFQVSREPIKALLFTDNGKTLMVANESDMLHPIMPGSEANIVSWWNARAGKLQRRIYGLGRDEIALSPDGKTVATTRRYLDTIRLWRIQ